MSQAELQWLAPEEWFQRRNLTKRILQLFPLIDANHDAYVDVAELEKWHHINKVFVEKARAAQSLVRAARHEHICCCSSEQPLCRAHTGLALALSSKALCVVRASRYAAVYT